MTARAAAPPHQPEIDGLRAIAIVPVVLYHAGWTLFSGGFAGVDVFFVISGFLITRIIYDDVRGGEFSIARFYERRLRRIVPALLVMLLCVSAIACLMAFPEDLILLARACWQRHSSRPTSISRA